MNREDLRTLREVLREVSSVGGQSETGGNSSARYLPRGQRVRLNTQKLAGMRQIEFPEADDPVAGFDDHSLHIEPSTGSHLSNTVRSGPDGRVAYVDANREGAAKDGERAIRRAVRERIRTLLNESAERVNWSRERDPDGTEPLGLVPMQMDTYETIRSEMPPREFLRLAVDGGDASDYMVDRMAQGHPIAPPFLMARYVHGPDVWVIAGHEGRHRTRSAIRFANPRRIPVDIILREAPAPGEWGSALQSSHVTDEQRRALIRRVVPQEHAVNMSRGDFLRRYAEPADITLLS